MLLLFQAYDNFCMDDIQFVLPLVEKIRWDIENNPFHLNKTPVHSRCTSRPLVVVHHCNILEFRHILTCKWNQGRLFVGGLHIFCKTLNPTHQHMSFVDIGHTSRTVHWLETPPVDTSPETALKWWDTCGQLDNPNTPLGRLLHHVQSRMFLSDMFCRKSFDPTTFETNHPHSLYKPKTVQCYLSFPRIYPRGMVFLNHRPCNNNPPDTSHWRCRRKHYLSYSFCKYCFPEIVQMDN